MGHVSDPQGRRQAAPLCIGARVDSYRIVGALGRGSFGDVWLVEHHITHTRYALKVLAASEAQRRQSVDRAIGEAAALSQLHHPNLVHVANVGFLPEGRVWIALELLHGRTLHDLLCARGQLPVDEALGYLAGFAAGLACAHRAEVIHRDIKPANLFVTDDGTAKVLDFGVARMHRFGVPRTETRTIVGSFGYMAPEQMRGARLDGRADIFALGVVLYEMLAGRHPFLPEGDQRDAERVLAVIVQRMVEGAPSLARLLPSGVWQLLREMLSVRPDDRPANMEEVARRCVELLDEGAPPPRTEQTPLLPGGTVRLEPVEVTRAIEQANQNSRSTLRSLPSTPPPRRRRSIALALALVALLVVVALVLFIALRPSMDVALTGAAGIAARHVDAAAAAVSVSPIAPIGDPTAKADAVPSAAAPLPSTTHSLPPPGHWPRAVPKPSDTVGKHGF